MIKSIKSQHILSAVASLILFASVPVVLAWTNPTEAPPNGNTPAPINVSSNSQIKNGFLGLYGGPAGMAISRGDNSYSLQNGLSLGVKGKIGADFYCNADGTKCYDIDQLAGNNVVNNYSTTTTNGCRYVQGTSNVNVKAAGGNNKAGAQMIATLIPGTWTIKGEGTSGRGCSKDKCGSPGVWIRVTSGMSPTAAGYKPLVSKLGKWTIPETTFTVSQNEEVRALAYEAALSGTMTITGPRLSCD